jgi:hypothetical protein
MHWSRGGRLFFLAEESKLPHHLLSRLSVVSYSSLIRQLYRDEGSFLIMRLMPGDGMVRGQK